MKELRKHYFFVPFTAVSEEEIVTSLPPTEKLEATDPNTLYTWLMAQAFLALISLVTTILRVLILAVCLVLMVVIVVIFGGADKVGEIFRNLPIL